jgi:phosphoribosylformylglycinamidine synthase subunit PurQ / glutaminase
MIEGPDGGQAVGVVTTPVSDHDDVAGIVNESSNVMGLMPHPERACDALLGSEDGAIILGSILDSVSMPTTAAR